MANQLQVEIVTPARRLASVTADEIRAPGAMGGFGVRPGHVAFVTTTVEGEVALVEGSKVQKYRVGPGFLQVASDRVLALVDSAEAVVGES